MSLDPSIPLSVKPIEVASPLQTIGGLMQLRGAMTQQLLHQAQIEKEQQQTAEYRAVAEQRNRDLQSNRLLQGVMMNPANHDALGKGDYSSIWKAGVSPAIATPAIENLQKQAQSALALQKGKAEQLATGHALLGQTIAGLDVKDDDVAAQQWNAALPILAQSHPEISAELQHLAPGPNFRQQLQGIAAANGVARSIYENSAKLEAEQAGTAQKKSETEKNQAEASKITAELPGVTAEGEKKALVTQAMKEALADPTKGAAAIDAALPSTTDAAANSAYKAAWQAAMGAGNVEGAAAIVKTAAEHATSLSAATRANKVQTATEELKATEPIRIAGEIGKERVLIPMREQSQLKLEIDKAKLAPNGFENIIDPRARAMAYTQYDAQNKEALTKLQEANRLQSLITSAQGKNKAAPALIPLQELKQFVPRVNRNELQAVSSQAGNVYDRVQGWLSGATEGQPIPAAILQDMYKLADAQKAVTIQNNKLGVAAMNASHGTKVPTVDWESVLGSVAPAPAAGGNRRGTYNPATGHVEYH